MYNYAPLMGAGLVDSYFGMPGQMQSAMGQMAGLQQQNAQNALAMQLAQMQNNTARYGIDAQRYGYDQGTKQAEIGAGSQNYGADQQTEQARIAANAQQNVANQRTSALAALLSQYAGNFGNQSPEFKFTYGLPNPQATQTTLSSMMPGRG